MRQPDSKFQYIQYAPTDICLLYIWKSGGTKKNFPLAPLANPVLYPTHLKIRGAAHEQNANFPGDLTGSFVCPRCTLLTECQIIDCINVLSST